MSFILSTGAADMALAWQQLSASQRSTIKQEYEAAGIKLLVSAFGSTETPTTSGKDAKQLASTMAAWVKQYDVDGLDVDYEDLAAMNKADGEAEQWLVDFTNALRAELPQGQYILTHAPMAPWMGSGNQWTSGAYVTVNKQVGSQINWYNTQFYNQGASEYTTCGGLLTASSSSNPKSSVFEIEANGFDLNKIVIGKPAATADATNGQMDTSTLSQCVTQAQAKGWSAGVMAWEYPDADSAWISAVTGGSAGAGSAASAAGTGASATAGTGVATVAGTGASATAGTGAATAAGAGASATVGTGAATAAGTGASTAADLGAFTPPVSASSQYVPSATISSASATTPTHTFNDGMWTPTAPAATGAPAVKRTSQNIAPKNKMVRRRRPSNDSAR
ncbi:glycoside hydrolase family 18 protein [Collybiopsis luxurians FD-317 M1]|uniref:Glycoside hydrolase family 18 protein n=1 Tax=Collybiopsis luxurians FD-317 M1 TaxID=944289 RepID=A0A0D0ATU5_9AGAR|nr:glycoside hydrolase family 18 protein [Collybiopsis luxurians FD-317 M1]